MLEYTFENMYHEKGYRVICGVDEAGRGPLAGNVVAAAVIMPDGLCIDGLNDSKKLSEKKREALFDIIKETCILLGSSLYLSKSTIFSFSASSCCLLII